MYLDAERKKYNRHIQSSKIYLIMLFLSCFSVQVYAMIAMWHFCDLSSLSTLIGATLTEGIGLLGYFCKSYMETKEEERIKLEKEKLALSQEDESVG